MNEIRSNRVKTAFFFKNLRKIAQRLGAKLPDPHSLRRLGALPPDPVNDTFELQSLLYSTRLSI